MSIESRWRTKGTLKIYKTCLLPVMALLLLYGCASVPKSLTSEDQEKIRSVVLETVLEDDQANVLDISQIRKQEYSKAYGGMMYGAIGGALESLIKEGIARYKINSLVGGSIDPIRESISGYDTKAVFDDLVLRGITQNMKQLNQNIPRSSAARTAFLTTRCRFAVE